MVRSCRGYVAVWLAMGLCLAGTTAAAEEPGRESTTQGRGRVTAGVLMTAASATAAVAPSVGEVLAARSLRGGITLHVPVSRRVAVDGRVSWVRRGGRVDQPAGAQQVLVDYVTVPVQVQVRGTGRVRPYLSSGLEIAFRVSARETAQLAGVRVVRPLTDDIRPVDLGAVVGMGLERSLPRLVLLMEVSYTHGLRNVAAPGWDVRDARTRTLTATAGVRF